MLFTLKNNLKILYTKRPNSPVVAISLRVNAGSIYEERDEVGVAHFLEHILFDGTEKFPTQEELSKFIDAKGAYRNAITYKENVNYVTKILKEESEAAFEYLSQIVSRPLIQEKEIEKEKLIIEQEISRFKTDPKLYSTRLIYSVLFPNTRLGMLNTGDINDIKRINQSIVYSYWKRNYVANNMMVSIVGDLPEETIKLLSEKYFEQILTGEVSGFKLDKVESIKDPKTEVISSLKQATLVIGNQGYTMDQDEKYAMDIISTILTKGKSSRLNQEIREKRGLAYSVFSENLSFKHHGVFYTSVGLSESNITECIRIINEKTKEIYEVAISSEELKRAFIYLKSQLSFLSEDSLAMASYYSNIWGGTGEIMSIEDILMKYKSMIENPVFIQKTAESIFKTSPSILLLASRGF